ncbi:MAG: hypothetical protein KA373_04225, partial [Paludibacteraceae bacterium]|nr:hypothetical protein [Paludibacteraceae bacterium]
MKRILTLVAFLLGILFLTQAQETTNAEKPIIPVVTLNKDVTVKFGGFMRAEYYVDSREMVGAIDDLFGFFPEKVNLDANGDDINAVVRHNFSSQATRFNALFGGPSIFKAKSSAFFEFDFTGGTNVNLRYRHAYGQLSWKKADLLLGKSWNPLASVHFPSILGLHTAIPFRPFGRGDQVRVTYRPTDKISILMAALIQTEHRSALESSAAGDVRGNPIPDMHLQLFHKTDNLLVGLLSEYKITRPATFTTGTLGQFVTKETVSSFALGGILDYKKDLFNAKASVLYSQNLSELYIAGGYATTSIDATTGHRTYSPSNSVSSWVNLTYGKKWIAGVFGGYHKNLGYHTSILASTPTDTTLFGRWQDVDYIYRASTSLTYKIERWVFATEIDYNIAAYGAIDY